MSDCSSNLVEEQLPFFPEHIPVEIEVDGLEELGNDGSLLADREDQNKATEGTATGGCIEPTTTALSEDRAGETALHDEDILMDHDGDNQDSSTPPDAVIRPQEEDGDTLIQLDEGAIIIQRSSSTSLADSDDDEEDDHYHESLERETDNDKDSIATSVQQNVQKVLEALAEQKAEHHDQE
ncbi:unnamed protein product, partial [Amoebophrya sp. A25]